ncbi:hypothetical protein Tco_0528118 [Tanacetum coccineum]
MHYQRTGKVKIQFHDRSSFILEDVRYVPGLRRSLISLGTLEKKGYTVQMQMGRIMDKQLEEKTNTNCLVNEQEKVHLSIKMEANIMVTGVPGQEGAPRFKVPAQGKDAEYRLCLSVTPKVEIVIY